MRIGLLALTYRASGRQDVELWAQSAPGMAGITWEFPKNRGTLFWGPDIKDPTISGTILGSPIFGNSHIVGPAQESCSLASRLLCFAFCLRPRPSNQHLSHERFNIPVAIVQIQYSISSQTVYYYTLN